LEGAVLDGLSEYPYSLTFKGKSIGRGKKKRGKRGRGRNEVGVCKGKGLRRWRILSMRLIRTCNGGQGDNTSPGPTLSLSQEKVRDPATEFKADLWKKVVTRKKSSEGQMYIFKAKSYVKKKSKEGRTGKKKGGGGKFIQDSRFGKLSHRKKENMWFRDVFNCIQTARDAY